MDTNCEIHNDLEEFRQAGLSGDDQAAMRLESQFGDRLARFVRRIIRKGRGTGSLAEFVLQEAASIRKHRVDLGRDELVAELISRLCLVITGQRISGRVDTAAVKDNQTVIAM